MDPEANIILGATFDDALEGTMRVSVVATGLAVEARAQKDDGSEEATEEQASMSYNPAPASVKIVKPAPMVARIPSPTPAPEMEHHDEAMEEYHNEEIAPAHQQNRIPSIDKFPMIAQRQVAAQQGRIESIAEHANKRKKGIFERLADVGLGRREEQHAEQRPAQSRRAEPKIQPQAQRRIPAPEPIIAEESSYDDDQLAIPAFLRRQAN